MKYSTQIKPISYLKCNAADVVKELSETREPMLITQNGEAKLIVMDVRSYDEYQETMAMLKLLALGKSAAESGKIRDAEDVFADLDNEESEAPGDQ